VAADGSAREVADGLAFPNGMAVTPDNGTLIVAESFAARLTAFDVAADGSLSNRRVWADVTNHDNILRGGLIAKMNIYPEDVVEKGDKKNPPPQSSDVGDSGRN